MNGMDGQGIEMVPALASALFGNHEAGIFQDAQMLHDGAAIKLGEKRTEHAGGAGFDFEMIQNGSAHAVAESLENSIICVVG